MWDPKGCVLIIAQQNFPGCKILFFPVWSLWSGGGATPLLLWCTDIVVFLCPLKKVAPGYRGGGGVKSKKPLGNHFVYQNYDFIRGWTSNITHWGMLRQ